VTDLQVSSLSFNVISYPQLRWLTIKDEPRDLVHLQTALVMGIKSCPHLELIRYSYPKAFPETRKVTIGAIEASGHSQRLILEQLKYEPVILGQSMREVTVISTIELNSGYL